MRRLSIVSLICSLLALLTLSGCGGGGSNPTPPATSSDFVYESNNNQISVFQVNSAGTVIGNPPPATGPASGGGLALTSTNFLYAADTVNNAVQGFSVNASTGMLTTVPGSPFTVQAGQQGAQGMSVDPAGKFLYVTQHNTNQVAAFTINSAGQLMVVPGSPFTTGTFPVQSIVDPSGKYLYVSNNQDALGSISAYTISTSGALTPIPGSPFSTLVNGGPSGLAIHPNGNFLYIAMSGATGMGTQVVGQVINTSTGALSLIPGSPFTVGNEPSAVAIDPAGKFLFVTNMTDNTVSVFSISSSSGALTPVSGGPFSTGPMSNPFMMAINSASSVLFVVNANSTSISVFGIGSTGALTTLAPLQAGGGANGIAIVHHP